MTTSMSNSSTPRESEGLNARMKDPDIQKLYLHVKFLYSIVLLLTAAYVITVFRIYNGSLDACVQWKPGTEDIGPLDKEIRHSDSSRNRSGRNHDTDYTLYRREKRSVRRTGAKRSAIGEFEVDVTAPRGVNASADPSRHPVRIDTRWILMPTASRIPSQVLQEFCTASKDYCPEVIHGRPGHPGVIGPPGMPGLPGSPGPKGTDGRNGSNGKPGHSGVAGLDGRNGTDGAQGMPGVRGTPGEPGLNGTDGRPGPVGPKGDKGEVVEKNCTCSPGPKGIKGEPGSVFTDSLVKWKEDDDVGKRKGDGGKTKWPRVPTNEINDETPESFNLITTTAETTIPPRIDNSRLRIIAKPVFQRYTGTMYGFWSKDTSPRRDISSDSVYATKLHVGNILLEYETQDSFRRDQLHRAYELTTEYVGTGHIVYNGSFYYQRLGKNEIIKYDLATERETARLVLTDAVFEGSECLFSTDHNYVDFSADENGLWLVYAIDSITDSLIVAKLNAVNLAMEKVWNINVQRRSYSNGFIACGVLYLVRDTRAKITMIDFAYDLYEERKQQVSLRFINPFQMNNMIAYNHLEQQIYSWDKGNQLVYHVNL